MDALQAIVLHCVEALSFLEKMDERAFAADRRTFHATTRCLESVSEASRRLSDRLRAEYPDLDWRAMADAGNYYRHQYDGVAENRVFRTVVERLPDILVMARAELAKR